MKPAALTLLAISLTLTGCAAGTPRAAQPTEAAPTATPTGCLDVDQTTVDAITTGLLNGITIARASAHPADGYENVTLVATELAGEGIQAGQAIAVFATNDDVTTPGQDGLILAVPAIATEFSDWGDSSTTDAAITSTTPGVDEAKTCLG